MNMLKTICAIMVLLFNLQAIAGGFYVSRTSRTRWHKETPVYYHGYLGYVRKGDIDRWQRALEEQRKADEKRWESEKAAAERNKLNDKRAELKRNFSFVEADFVSAQALWENIKGDFRGCEFDEDGTNKVKRLVLQWTTISRDVANLKGNVYSDNSVVDVVAAEMKQAKARIGQFEKNLESFIAWVPEHVKVEDAEAEDEDPVDSLLKDKFALDETGLYLGKSYPAKYVHAALFVERFKELSDNGELEDAKVLKDYLGEQVAVLETVAKRLPVFRTALDTGKSLMERI